MTLLENYLKFVLDDFRRQAHCVRMDCTQEVKPEWIKVSDATRIFGIGRTRLYDLIGRRVIKTALLRERGNLQGARLISYDSLAEYIEGFVEQDTQESPLVPR